MVSKIPTVGISLKAQTERINGLLEGYLRHFSANQPEGLELLDVAQCCYKLTTKKLCVELQPLRVGHGATASDAPHHCGRRGLAHQPTLPRKTWQERNDLAQTTYLNNLKAWPGLKEEESRPCREADRRGSL